jgi:crotonobetainyl-CoA:carnitine CoA-transferase CaiB-like acyl-CoA transferase
MRFIQPFPESGAMKVLQGKESVALNLAAAESQEILRRIAGRADLVLCSFRAGVADRLGVGASDLLKANPVLVYLDAPGYGIEGPYGNRPAFAPTMAAGSGIAMRNAGALVPEDNTEDLPTLRARAIQLTSAGGGSATQPDGIAALVVGTALALGGYLRERGCGGQHMLTTMLQSCAHALADDMVEYNGRPAAPQVDAGGYGFSARYRLYQAADGWVFLAVPSARDWQCLTTVAAFASLAADPRFATEPARCEHDGDLAATLGEILATRAAADWERDLLAADVGCVVADPRTVEVNYITEFGQQHGFLATVDSPVLGEYPRVGPIVSFSRSATTATVGCTLGQHTGAVLREFGYDEAVIKDLADRGVVICG